MKLETIVKRARQMAKPCRVEHGRSPSAPPHHQNQDQQKPSILRFNQADILNN